jgi:VWFA-related protein
VLDVVVTDKHGNLVRREDLTKDDFTIYESKVPQKILSFEPPTSHAMPMTDKPIVNSAADLKKIGDAPVTILVLDELNSQFEDMSFARQMMVKYLQAQPPVLRQPTLLTIAQNTKFVQVHDYTQNRDELIEDVKKHIPEYPWRAMRGSGGGPVAVEQMAQGLAALQQLAQASRGTPGRKNVIWVGNGNPTADLIGLDQQHADQITGAVRAVTAKLLASRITIYTINPMAGTSSTIDVETPDDLNTAAASSTGMDPFGSGTVNFTDFALSTGGMSFRGRNDLNNVIAEGIAQGNEYYTMSYSPTDKSDNPQKFRDISIVMKDPNLRATTRNGYFQATAADVNPLADKTLTDKQKQRDLQLDLSQALTSEMSYNGLHIRASKNGSDYAIHVAEGNLTWSDPGSGSPEHTEATVAAAWYDSKGKLVGHVVREEIVPRGAANSGAVFTLTLPDLPRGVTRMRFFVRDALNGQIGTADVAP